MHVAEIINIFFAKSTQALMISLNGEYKCKPRIICDNTHLADSQSLCRFASMPPGLQEVTNYSLNLILITYLIIQ